MAESKLMKMINWILNILIVIFGIGVVYMIVVRIFGNSPTDFQIILWIAGFLGSSVLKLFSLVYGINREVGELKINVKNGFSKVKEDINELKNDVKEIKNLLTRRKK